MAVTAAAGDTAGAALDARITAIIALQALATPGSAQAFNLYKDLRQAQKSAVIYYLDRNRIDSAVVLSTLS